MSNTKKPDPERPDEDNPEWTRADMTKARPATEVLPGLIGATATEELLRRGKGRPPKEHPKVNQTIRIDPDVLEAYRQEGKAGRRSLMKCCARTCQGIRNETLVVH